VTVEDGEHAMSGDLTFRAIDDPHEEHAHFQRQRGRVSEDYRRFTQIGVAKGWIQLPGQRLEIEDWWACRDHSWGVRQGMGTPEPKTGVNVSLAEKGHVHAFLYFSTSQYCGSVQLVRRGDDEGYTTGVVRNRVTGELLELAGMELGVSFREGTRRFQTARLGLSFVGGLRLSIAAEAAGCSVAMPGIGYSGGFNDNGGPGVWRGVNHVEHDVWDVSDPVNVVTSEGETRRPWHRIQPVRVLVGNGSASEGFGSLTLTVSGKVPRYLGGE
jgi:hypothetical protein